MANIKISQLTNATTPLAGTENVEVVQAAGSYKTTVADIGNSATAVPFASLAGRAYADFYSTSDQTGSTSAGTEAIFNTTVLNTGVTLANNGGGNPTRVTFTAAGKYRVKAFFQCVNAGASDYVFTTWIAINGTDVVASAAKTVVAKTGDGGVEGVEREWIITVTAAQYATIMWLVSNTSVSLDATSAAAGPPAVPAFPSVRVTAERVV